MKTLHNLKECLEKEIDEIVSSSRMTSQDLNHLDKAVDIIKDIETIWAMKNYDYPADTETRYIRKYTEPDKDSIRANLRNLMASTKNDKEREVIQMFLTQWRD